MLAVSANAPKGTLIDNGQKFSGWQLFLMFIGFTMLALVLIIGSWCFMTRCVMKKYKERQKREADQMIKSMKEETLQKQETKSSKKVLINPSDTCTE